jgi:hypothetical protein
LLKAWVSLGPRQQMKLATLDLKDSSAGVLQAVEIVHKALQDAARYAALKDS